MILIFMTSIVLHWFNIFHFGLGHAYVLQDWAIFCPFGKTFKKLQEEKIRSLDRTT